ncbi:MAG: SH3 domain-containing protein, partial [Anaerolineae bacterium]|nr:SH3 domain-containing protein [Anaerolineae bacterium]
PAVIERHVAQAQGAGIDALVQSWYGPQVENNQTETNFRTLLDIAAARGFKAAVDVEVTSPFLGGSGAVSQALATLLATHAQHPAYLRYQGKPVIFFWRQQQYSVDTWAGIRGQVDPNHDTIWIAEGTDLAYQAVFDGHHLYNIAWADSPADQLARWGDRMRSYEAENQVDRLWVATAMPGYNDTNLPRGNAFAVSRQGGDYLRTTWRGAIASQPDMVIITSFNEWLEGTQLEPSASYGNLYLDVARELVTELRGSPPPEPAPLQVASEPTPDSGAPASEGEKSAPATSAGAQSPPPDGPYIETAAITNVRSGPSTDFETVGRLDAGQTASVIGRTEAADWWLVEFTPVPESQGWVSGEVVEFVGEVADVPVVEVETAASETEATVDSADEAEAEPEATVEAESEDEAAVDEPTEEAATATPTVPRIAGSIEVTDAINVRDEPSIDGEVVGALYQGETADVLAVSEDGDWWLVEFAGGPDDRAWVAGEFVEFEGDPATVPIFGLGTPTPTASATPNATITPTPTPLPVEQPTFAPTATSIYDATSAALLAARGTPDPSLLEPASDDNSTFGWSDLPWGILSLVVIAGFFWYQFVLRRRQ